MLEAARGQVELEAAPLELLQVFEGGEERGLRLVSGCGAVGNTSGGLEPEGVREEAELPSRNG